MKRVREWKRKHPRKDKARWQRWMYNLEPWQVREMLRKQHSKCGICHKKMKVRHIDHDHKHCKGDRSCGDCVRGLLCADCNRGLGSFHDCVKFLLNAVRYLRNFQRRTHVRKAETQAHR